MLLNGTSSHAETAGAGGLTTGASARTLAAIINRTSSSGFRNVVSLLTSGNATVLDMTFNGTTMLAEAPGGGSNGPTVGTGKMYVALDKASGNATPRFHKQIYGTDTVVAHSAGSGSINDTGTIAKVGVGAFETSGDFFAGDIYVVAAWSRQLSDAEHELLAGSVAAWRALQPDWLIVEFNAVLPSSLQDSSSNGGAPLSSLTSISASTTSMPVAIGGPFADITHPGAAGGGPINVTLIEATETDAAQALDVDKTLSITAATETSSAQALDLDKQVTLTPAASTETAVALSVTKTIFKDLVAATETDTAQALSVTHTHLRTLTPATETDEAQALSITHTGGPIDLVPATETDQAVSLSFTKTIFVTLTPAAETSAAVALDRDKTVTLTPASESDSATGLSVTHVHYRTLTHAAETDEAIALVYVAGFIPAANLNITLTDRPTRVTLSEHATVDLQERAHLVLREHA